MKKNKQSAIMAWITSLFNFDVIPTNTEGKADFSEDQRSIIEKQLGVERAQRLYDNLNAELASEANSVEQTAALEAVLKELDIEVEGTENASTEDKHNLITAKIAEMQKDLKDQKEQIAKMAKGSVGDHPAAVLNTATDYAKQLVMKHTATHLFGLNSVYNAFENRPWNARLRDGSAQATAFTASDMEVLQADFDHFVGENPKAIDSLMIDFNQLPKEWKTRTGVATTVTDAGIDVGEIVQGRKDHWAPKNKFVITVEPGKVYPKQIDIEFTAAQLQAFESTWVRNVINLDGTHPWKNSFIGFILTELMKRAAVDDRIAQIKGVYVPTPEGQAGAAVNSQDGLLMKYFIARDVEKKIRPFPIGVPTANNAVDWFKQLVELLPEDVRNSQGLEIQCDPKFFRYYKEDAGLRYNHKFETDQGKLAYEKNHVIDYPNIIFQPLVDFAGTGFMAVTYSENMEILEFDPSEKGKFTQTHEKRNTILFADYRLGIRVKRMGIRLAENHPDKYRAQMVWCNDAPIFPEGYKVPVFDQKNGILTVKNDNVIIGDNFTNDITSIEGVTEGRVITITGNNNLQSGTVKIVDGGTLDLASDFVLKTEGSLTLFAKPGGGFKELARTSTAPVVEIEEKTYDTAVIDAVEGSIFKFSGAAALSVTNILNGIEQKQITVYGGPGAAVTIVQTGNIKLSSALSLADGTKFVKLVYVAGKWYETARG